MIPEEKINELDQSLKDWMETQSKVIEDNQERLDDIQTVMNRPAYKDTNGQTIEGGKALDGDGSVKVYTPEQKFAADSQLDDEFKDVTMEGFFRGVVGKPRNEKERALAQKSVSSGDYELPSHIADTFIDNLRAQNPLLRPGGAGARTVALEGGDTKYITITSDPSASWHAELNQESEVDPTFDVVTLSPKTVMAVTTFSNELLQDSTNVANAISSAFTGSLNTAIMNATFGTTTGNGPTGLASTVTQTEEYTNGGSPDWSHFVNASATLHGNNVPEGNRSFIHSKDVWQNLALASDDNGRYQDAPSFIRNIPNHVSSGLNSGEAYVGDFSNVVYGFRRGITLRGFPGAAAKSYGTVFVAVARVDIATFRPSALVRIQEAAA